MVGVVVLRATDAAFAALRDDGSVITWGDATTGGDSSALSEQLQDIVDVQATTGAFAASRSNGSVVTWGHDLCGGDSSCLHDQLKDVQQVCANQSVSQPSAGVVLYSPASPLAMMSGLFSQDGLCSIA